MDADVNTSPSPPVDHLYELDSLDSIEADVLPGLEGLGYVVDGRGENELTLLALRRPRWATVAAVFLFPVGLPLLLVRRPRELRLSWREPAFLMLAGSDCAAQHLMAQVGHAHTSELGWVETAAPPFAAGACCVAIAWLASVQLLDDALSFVTAMAIAILVGCGIGTLITTKRAARSDDPRDPVVWGVLPALAGGFATTAAFALLVAVLVLLGAG